MVECLAMFRAEKEKPGVRGNVEGRLLQTIIFQIHVGCYLRHCPRQGKQNAGSFFGNSSRKQIKHGDTETQGGEAAAKLNSEDTEKSGGAGERRSEGFI